MPKVSLFGTLRTMAISRHSQGATTICGPKLFLLIRRNGTARSMNRFPVVVSSTGNARRSYRLSTPKASRTQRQGAVPFQLAAPSHPLRYYGSTLRANMKANLGSTGHFRYRDFGHSAGSTIWWVDNAGKVQTFISTGHEFHHDLNKRMDMDIRWRGRLQPDGICTLLPPISQPEPEAHIPAKLLARLKKLGARTLLLADIAGRLHKLT